MKKHLLFASFFALLFVACVPEEGAFDHIDFSGPCQEPVTKVTIKTTDAYSKASIPNQKFRLKLREIFSSEKMLKEVVTSDSGSVSFSFEQDRENWFNSYWVEQVLDSNDYVAVQIPPLSIGCSNELNISMKKPGVLSVLLKNESPTSHGECELAVYFGVGQRRISIDTFPMGYSKTFEVTKLPEERVAIWLYALRSTFKQQDTLRANQSDKESYIMTVR